MSTLEPASFERVIELLDSQPSQSHRNHIINTSFQKFREKIVRFTASGDGGRMFQEDLERFRGKAPVVLDEGCGGLTTAVEAASYFGEGTRVIGLTKDMGLLGTGPPVYADWRGVIRAAENPAVAAYECDIQRLSGFIGTPVDFCYSHMAYDKLTLPFTTLFQTAEALAPGGVAYVYPVEPDFPAYLDFEGKNVGAREFLRSLDCPDASFEMMPEHGCVARVERRTDRKLNPRICLGVERTEDGGGEERLVELAGWPPGGKAPPEGFLTLREYSDLLKARE